MVGHKSSLPPLKKLLRDTIVASFKQSEFYQGNTVRWALAWTFHDNVDLRTIPEDTVIAARKSKLKPPLTHTIKSELASLTSFDEKLTKIFADLQMHVENTKRSKNVKGYCLTAVSNTWSHQRTKRRAQQRLNSVLDSSVSGIENTAEMVAQLTVASSPSKRVLEEYNDEDEERKQKKLKPGELENNNCYLKCIFVVRKEKCQITIELSYVEGSAGRDGLQQVMQYVKNHIDLC